MWLVDKAPIMRSMAELNGTTASTSSMHKFPFDHPAVSTSGMSQLESNSSSTNRRSEMVRLRGMSQRARGSSTPSEIRSGECPTITLTGIVNTDEHRPLHVRSAKSASGKMHKNLRRGMIFRTLSQYKLT